MLEGSLLDKIVLFALPFAVSSILQQLFNAADLAVVGRFASSEAMAAVGSNSSVINLNKPVCRAFSRCEYCYSRANWRGP